MNWDKYSRLETFLQPGEPAEKLPSFDEFWKLRDRTVARDRKKTRTFRAFGGSAVAAAAVAFILFIFNFRTNGFYGPDGRMITAGWTNTAAEYYSSGYDGHRIALSPGAKVGMNYMKDRGSVEIVLENGKVICHPRHLKTGETFRVRMPDATVTAVGTVFSAEADQQRRKVTVLEGSVELSIGPGRTNMTVPAGTTYEWKTGGKPERREMDNGDLRDTVSALGFIPSRKLDWSMDLGTTAEVIPSIGSGPHFVSSGGDLWKLEGHSGMRKVFSMNDGTPLGRPVTSGNLVAVGSPYGGLHVAEASGKTVYDGEDIPGSLVFVPMSLGRKFAAVVSINSGVLIVRFGAGEKPVQLKLDGENVFAGTVLSRDGRRLYLGTDAGALVCIDTDKMKILKRVPVFTRRIEFPPVQTDDDLVLLDRSSGKLCFVDLKSLTGQYLNVPFLAGSECLPVAGNHGVYWRNSADPKGRLVLAGRASGKPAANVIAEFGGTITGLAFSDDRIAAMVNGSQLFVMNGGGKLLHREDIGGSLVGNDRDGVYLQNGNLLRYHVLQSD